MKSLRPWFAAGLVVTFCAAGVVWAADAPAAGSAPAAGPAAPAATAPPAGEAPVTMAPLPAEPPAPAPKVSDEAKKAIQGMLAAYAAKKDYQGTFALTKSIQVGKNNQGGTVNGTVRLSRPNKLYVQLAADKVSYSVSCDGQQCMAYYSPSQKYMVWKEPENMDSVLGNGPLLAALQDMTRVTLVPFFSDAYTTFLKGVTSAEMGPAEEGKGTHLRLEVSSGEMDIYLDPQTFLVTEAHAVPTHVIEMAKAQNPDLGDVKITVDLKQQEVHAGEPMPADAFPTAAPKDAKLAATLEDLTSVPPPPALKEMVDFQLPTLTEGKTVKLSDYKGKVVVVDFWATWCAPCRAELPILQDIYKELADKGMVLIAVDLMEQHDTVAEFVKQLGLDVPVALDVDGKVGDEYQVEALPTLYVFDKAGKVAAHIQGLSPATKDKLKDLITKLLEGTPAAAAPAAGAAPAGGAAPATQPSASTSPAAPAAGAAPAAK